MRMMARGALLAAAVALAACQAGPDDATADIAVGNAKPQISGAPATVAFVGTAYAFQPVASDPDGDAMIFGSTAGRRGRASTRRPGG